MIKRDIPMLQELIILFACLGTEDACDQTRFTYLHHNPQTKIYLNNVENKVKRYVPKKYYSNVIVPAAVAISRGEFNIPINKNITISYNNQNEIFSTKLTYGFKY